MSARGAARLWEVLVRQSNGVRGGSRLGEWEEAERLQRMAGRMALGVANKVANEVVRGELGWWTVRARREYLRIVYWGKLMRMRNEGGIMGEVVDVGLGRVFGGKEIGWWGGTKRIMGRMGLGGVWWTGEVGGDEEWKKKVREMIQLTQEEEWARGMVGMDGGRTKVKLERYVRMKKKLRKEGYLGESRVWVRRWVEMRAGVVGVEEERG